MLFKIKILITLILLIALTGCKAYYNAFYTDPTKCFKIACSKKPYDVIIVPGFPHDSGTVNGILNERIKWTNYLYKNGYAKNIIFSGSAVHTPYIEAKIMRLLALQSGIKDENIFIETKAEHTTENLYYSCVLADELGFKTIGFATEPAQSSFMKPFRRKFKLKLDFVPVVTDSINSIPLKPIDESSAFVSNFIPLKKREGALKSLLGTKGQRVKKEIRKAKILRRKSTHDYDNK